jgi:hypothetical protein
MTAQIVKLLFFAQIVLLVAGLALWSYWPNVRRFLWRRREATRAGNRTLSELVVEHERSRPPQRVDESRITLDAARAAGYHTMIDVISIYGDDSRLGPAHIDVLSHNAERPNYLVMDVYEDDPGTPARKKLVRIDVFRNDAERELVLSLGSLQRLDDKCRSGRDVSRHAVKGIALAGERKGQPQEWHLDYYPG